MAIDPLCHFRLVPSCMRHGQMHKHLIQINESKLKHNISSNRVPTQRNINFTAYASIHYRRCHRIAYYYYYCMSFEYIYFLFVRRFIVSAICISLENYFLRPIDAASQHFVLMLFRFVPLEKTKAAAATTTTTATREANNR